MHDLLEIERDDRGRVTCVRADFWIVVTALALIASIACKILG